MKKNKAIKRIFVSLISTIMLFSTVSCTGTESESPLTSGDVSIGVASSMYKIMQDHAIEEYSDVLRKDVNVTMALGEYESAHLVITPTKKVEWFNVEMGELVHESDSSAKLGKDNVELFFEKYLKVDAIKDVSLTGMAPDGLVPLDRIVEYEENVIAANTNQAVYITFNTVPKYVLNEETGETEYEYVKTGKYTGTVTVDFGTFEQTVNVSVDVKNIIVPEENNFDSSMLQTWHYGNGELSDCQESLDSYSQMLIDYRLGPTILVWDNPFRWEDVEFYTDKAYEYMSQPRCPTISLHPSAMYYEYVDANGDPATETVMGSVSLMRYLSLFAQKSYEEDFDMFEKSNLYYMPIDEPKATQLFERLYVSCDVFKTVVKTAAHVLEKGIDSTEIVFSDPEAGDYKIDKELAIAIFNGAIAWDSAEGGFYSLKMDYVNGEWVDTQDDDKYKDETTLNMLLELHEIPEEEWSTKAATIESLRNFKNIVTTGYDASLAPWIDTFVPNLSVATTREHFSSYTQEETWWYNMGTSFGFTLDYPLYNGRLLFWAQSHYGIKGYLNWAVNMYAKMNSSGQYMPLEDYYDTAIRYSTTPGRAWYFYPGAQYGYDHPLASLRLESMRNGLEEAEIIRFIREHYNSVSDEVGVKFDAEDIIDYLGYSLYYDTAVSCDEELFEEVRYSLYQLAECATSKAQMCIVESSDDSYGNILTKVFLRDGYTLKNNGVEVTDFESVSGGKIYTVTNVLNKSSNVLQLSFECEGKTYEYVQQLGGRTEEISYSKFTSAFKKGTVTPTATVGDYKAELGITDEKVGSLIKVSLPATDGSYQKFKISNDVIKGIDSSVSKLVAHVYNPTNESVNVTISAGFGAGTVGSNLVTKTLKPGMNSIDITVGSLNLTNKSIVDLSITLGSTKTEPDRVLYFANFTKYYK